VAAKPMARPSRRCSPQVARSGIPRGGVPSQGHLRNRSPFRKDRSGRQVLCLVLAVEDARLVRTIRLVPDVRARESVGRDEWAIQRRYMSLERLAQTRLRLIEPDQHEEVTPALEPAIG